LLFFFMSSVDAFSRLIAMLQADKTRAKKRLSI